MILVLDNHDSFVETLARYTREAGFSSKVVRSDTIDRRGIHEIDPAGIILSPGPFGPDAAGVCLELPGAFPNLPLLGVCLGHLAIAESYGAKTIRAKNPIHGRATNVTHRGGALFRGVPTTFQAGRYHALASDISSTTLNASAWSDDGALMAFQHPSRLHFGVQFHPESILTPVGRKILGNFLEFCQ